jgi:hypothetical protein
MKWDKTEKMVLKKPQKGNKKSKAGHSSVAASPPQSRASTFKTQGQGQKSAQHEADLQHPYIENSGPYINHQYSVTCAETMETQKQACLIKAAELTSREASRVIRGGKSGSTKHEGGAWAC